VTGRWPGDQDSRHWPIGPALDHAPNISSKEVPVVIFNKMIFFGQIFQIMLDMTIVQIRVENNPDRIITIILLSSTYFNNFHC
jgi:hypothetical protein